jgi:hypothetical protein
MRRILVDHARRRDAEKRGGANIRLTLDESIVVANETDVDLFAVGGNNFDGLAYNAQIGNKDKAFEFLEKVYQRREYSINFIQVDPRLDNLHDDPRFAELVGRVESR